MSGYLDRDWFDRLQDERAEHAGMTGESLTLAETHRKASPGPSRSPRARGERRGARSPLDDNSGLRAAVPHTTTNPE
jgi:hypothetical protein